MSSKECDGSNHKWLLLIGRCDARSTAAGSAVSQPFGSDESPDWRLSLYCKLDQIPRRRRRQHLYRRFLKRFRRRFLRCVRLRRRLPLRFRWLLLLHRCDCCCGLLCRRLRRCSLPYQTDRGLKGVLVCCLTSNCLLLLTRSVCLPHRWLVRVRRRHWHWHRQERPQRRIRSPCGRRRHGVPLRYRYRLWELRRHRHRWTDTSEAVPDCGLLLVESLLLQLPRCRAVERPARRSRHLWHSRCSSRAVVWIWTVARSIAAGEERTWNHVLVHLSTRTGLPDVTVPGRRLWLTRSLLRVERSCIVWWRMRWRYRFSSRFVRRGRGEVFRGPPVEPPFRRRVPRWVVAGGFFRRLGYHPARPRFQGLGPFTGHASHAQNGQAAILHRWLLLHIELALVLAAYDLWEILHTAETAARNRRRWPRTRMGGT